MASQEDHPMGRLPGWETLGTASPSNPPMPFGLSLDLDGDDPIECGEQDQAFPDALACGQGKPPPVEL